MPKEQIAVLQQSFAKVALIADRTAVMFYERLFEVAPQVKAMFPADMAEQRQKLIATLGIVFNGLSNPESFLPAVGSLAKRHVAYGARLEHYRENGLGRVDANAGKLGHGRLLSTRP
jgi:nitric oxide dioxygenase